MCNLIGSRNLFVSNNGAGSGSKPDGLDGLRDGAAAGLSEGFLGHQAKFTARVHNDVVVVRRPEERERAPLFFGAAAAERRVTSASPCSSPVGADGQRGTKVELG